MITVITGTTYQQAHEFCNSLRTDNQVWICPENYKSTTEIVLWTERQITLYDKWLVITMNCDVVSAIRYIAEYYNKPAEFWLVDDNGKATNHESNIEPLFKEFNKSIKMIEKYQKD